MSDEPSTDEKLPGYPNYTLPAGIGIAYGIFSRGVVTYWPLEVVLFAYLWSLRGPLFKTWSYRAYVKEGEKLNMRPSRAHFVTLQTISTAILIFIVAFIVMGVRILLASE